MVEIKAWLCESGHSLGLVKRNGRGIRQLSLFRQAMDLEDPGDPPDVMALVVGHAIDVTCSICGSTRTWVEGEEAMRDLLEKAGRTLPNPPPSGRLPSREGEREKAT